MVWNSKLISLRAGLVPNTRLNKRQCIPWRQAMVGPKWHYDDVRMGAIASQITSLTIVYSTVYSNADQRKHQSSASLAFVWGIHRDRWIPRTKGQLRGKCFHLMTSSWKVIIDDSDFTSRVPYYPYYYRKKYAVCRFEDSSLCLCIMEIPDI